MLATENLDHPYSNHRTAALKTRYFSSAMSPWPVLWPAWALWSLSWMKHLPARSGLRGYYLLCHITVFWIYLGWYKMNENDGIWLQMVSGWPELAYIVTVIYSHVVLHGRKWPWSVQFQLSRGSNGSNSIPWSNTSTGPYRNRMFLVSRKHAGSTILTASLIHCGDFPGLPDL